MLIADVTVVYDAVLFAISRRHWTLWAELGNRYNQVDTPSAWSVPTAVALDIQTVYRTVDDNLLLFAFTLRSDV
jgi:hypothetical protein